MIEQNMSFIEQLKRHEGLRLEAYRCSAGALTVGYGHNCDVWPVDGVTRVGDVVSRARAEELLAEDIYGIAEDLDFLWPWWRGMDEPRQGVLLNMAFNMGVPRLKTFKRMLGALRVGDYPRAGTEMLDSKWANQVRGRAAELARQMVLGEWA